MLLEAFFASALDIHGFFEVDVIVFDWLIPVICIKFDYTKFFDSVTVNAVQQYALPIWNCSRRVEALHPTNLAKSVSGDSSTKCVNCQEIFSLSTEVGKKYSDITNMRVFNLCLSLNDAVQERFQCMNTMRLTCKCTYWVWTEM